MGVSWQTPDQKTFIEDHLHSYNQHAEAETTRTIFWPEFLEEWFKRWPLPEPAPELVEEVGVNKAKKALQRTQVAVSITSRQFDRLNSLHLF